MKHGFSDLGCSIDITTSAAKNRIGKVYKFQVKGVLL